MSLSISTENFVLGGRRHNPDTLAREGQEGGQASEQERLEGLKTVASLIEQLTQAGVSWQEIYQLVTQVGEILGKNYNDAEPKESVVSRFRQAIGRVKRAVSAQMENCMTSIASGLPRLLRSATFRKVVNSLLAIALSLQLTAPVLAADSEEKTLAPSVKVALVDSSGLGSQNETVFSPSRIADAESPDNQLEAEGSDFLEASLDMLGKHGLLDDLLMRLMIDIESDQEKEQIEFNNILIQDAKNKQILNYGLISLGKLSLDQKTGVLRFFNNSNTLIDRAIGIVVPEIPYMMYINKNTPQEGIQFFSGVTHWFGHCCGVDPNYRVFENLGYLQPGDRVVITTTNKLQYPFSVLSVGNVPKEYSTGMVYSDYKSALKFIAGVLLSTPEKPVSEEILTQVKEILNKPQDVSSAIESLQVLLDNNGINRNLAKTLQAFIEGRAMILMTCDSEATVRTPTGLASENRVVVIVVLEPGQELPGFLKPAVFLNPPDEKLDDEFAKKTIQALYQRYPSIVTGWVQRFMVSIPQTTATVPTTSTPVPIPTPVSNSDTESISQDGTQPSPQPTLSPQPQPQPQLSEEERIQKQIQEKIAHLQRLNAQVESVLPPISLIPGSAEIDLNKIINDIMSGDKIAPLHELLVFFVSEPERVAALQEYIQILESLTSALQGENIQHLQNFLYQLKLVKFLVENHQIVGGVLLGVLLSLTLARIRGRG